MAGSLKKKFSRAFIAKARMFLNWEPEIQLKDGLIQTIGYFKSSL